MNLKLKRKLGAYFTGGTSLVSAVGTAFQQQEAEALYKSLFNTGRLSAEFSRQKVRCLISTAVDQLAIARVIPTHCLSLEGTAIVAPTAPFLPSDFRFLAPVDGQAANESAKLASLCASKVGATSCVSFTSAGTSDVDGPDDQCNSGWDSWSSLSNLIIGDGTATDPARAPSAASRKRRRKEEGRHLHDMFTLSTAEIAMENEYARSCALQHREKLCCFLDAAQKEGKEFAAAKRYDTIFRLDYLQHQHEHQHRVDRAEAAAENPMSDDLCAARSASLVRSYRLRNEKKDATAIFEVQVEAFRRRSVQLEERWAKTKLLIEKELRDAAERTHDEHLKRGGGDYFTRERIYQNGKEPYSVLYQENVADILDTVQAADVTTYRADILRALSEKAQKDHRENESDFRSQHEDDVEALAGDMVRVYGPAPPLRDPWPFLIDQRGNKDKQEERSVATKHQRQCVRFYNSNTSCSTKSFFGGAADKDVIVEGFVYHPDAPILSAAESETVSPPPSSSSLSSGSDESGSAGGAAKRVISSGLLPIKKSTCDVQPSLLSVLRTNPSHRPELPTVCPPYCRAPQVFLQKAAKLVALPPDVRSRLCRGDGCA